MVGAAEPIKMTTDFYKDIVASSGAYKYYVNGEWKESTSGKTVPILNPSTNQAAYKVQGTLTMMDRASSDSHRYPPFSHAKPSPCGLGVCIGSRSVGGGGLISYHCSQSFCRP